VYVASKKCKIVAVLRWSAHPYYKGSHKMAQNKKLFGKQKRRYGNWLSFPSLFMLFEHHRDTTKRAGNKTKNVLVQELIVVKL
jgi:hypothetical protein